MRWQIASLCLGLVGMAPAEARAGPSDICDRARELMHVYSKSINGQSVDNPTEFAKLLLSLDLAITERLAIRSAPELVRIAQKITGLNASLQRATTGQSKAVGQTLYWTLAALPGDLADVQEVLDCQPNPTPIHLAQSPSAGLSHSTRGAGIGSNTSLLLPKLAYIFIPLLLLVLGIVTLFRVKRGREDERKICNIHLQVMYNEGCTITRIFDLSRSGMKIEAASKDIKKKWLDFRFGGQKIEGKIVWRSKLYAGVKFRKRLGKDVFEQILATNNKPISDSGIKKTSTACFHEGCQLDCPLHVPTALSLKVNSP